MDNAIILTEKAYNPRTKGAIKKFLAIAEIDHVMLGNGSTFTGFILNDEVTLGELKEIRKFVEELSVKDDINLDFKSEK